MKRFIILTWITKTSKYIKVMNEKTDYIKKEKTLTTF